MSPLDQDRTGHRLLQAGIALILLGLLVGFAVPALANPRMGLASHLEGVMNGLFLVVLGLVWPRLVVRQPSIDSLAGEDFASLARRSDAGVAGPTSRRSNAASGVKDRQEASIEG